MSFTRTAVQAQKRYEFVCSQLFMAKHTARGVRFLFRFNMYLFLARSDQVYLILAFTPPNKTRVQSILVRHTEYTHEKLVAACLCAAIKKQKYIFRRQASAWCNETDRQTLRPFLLRDNHHLVT